MSGSEEAQAHRDLCHGCGIPVELEQLAEGESFRPIGMVAESPGAGVFCFTHIVEGCGTTLAIPLRHFSHLIAEPIPDEILHGSAVCEGRCLHIDDLERCSQACGNAPYRALMLEWVARWNETHPEHAGESAAED